MRLAIYWFGSKFCDARIQVSSLRIFQPLLHNGLGLALDKLGLKEQAGAEFVKATDLEPTNASYRANIVAMKSGFSSERIATETGTLARLTPP